jgi:hypothetical protein
MNGISFSEEEDFAIALFIALGSIVVVVTTLRFIVLDLRNRKSPRMHERGKHFPPGELFDSHLREAGYRS